jgi:uncharacterized glyoxalase superfamily protein PhnB
MAVAKSYKPEGTHTLTPHLTVQGAARAMEFYKQAFGAVEIARMADPSGVVMHAEMQIGDSRFYLNDEFPDMGARGPKSIGGTAVTLHLYVPDCDALYKQALAAGATAKRPVADMFWGDRYGQVEDPYGHMWSVVTHKETLSEAEVWERMKQSMAQPSKG